MANLSTTIIENVTLNGQKTKLVTNKTITDVNNIMHRSVKIPTSQNTTLVTFQTSEHTSDGAMDLEDIKYIRISNVSTAASSDCTLSLQVAGAEGGTANMSASILLEQNKSFILGSVHDGISVGDTDATVITALTDLESIIAVCGSTEVTLEVFVATL